MKIYLPTAHLTNDRTFQCTSTFYVELVIIKFETEVNEKAMILFNRSLSMHYVNNTSSTNVVFYIHPSGFTPREVQNGQQTMLMHVP